MKNALRVIENYKGELPLLQYLKNYFRQNKNLGSQDRKILSSLVYNFFRVKGKCVTNNLEKLITAGAYNDNLLHNFYTYWNKKIHVTADEYLNSKKFAEYFPLATKVSDLIDEQEFFSSHFHQPKIFIRSKKNKLQYVLDELKSVNYEFSVEGKIISFSGNYALTTLKSFEKGYFEIQDIASQKTSELFNPQKNEAWWDCCAGSGGKSLLLLEQQPQIQLFVSDVRNSILHNLKERFYRNRYVNYNSAILDIPDATEKELNRLPVFDAILADVPCSGSGTWSRSPEWLSFFTEELLNKYAERQRKIISSVVNKLKSGGKLIYITCSVYAGENERNTEWFTKHLPLKPEVQKYFQYSKQGGDTLFGATMIKI